MSSAVVSADVEPSETEFEREMRTALEEIAVEAAKIIGFQDCAIALYHPTANELRTLASSNPTLDAPSRRFAPGEGVAGHVALAMRPILIRDVSQDPRFLDLRQRPIASALCVPIVHEDSRLMGTITAVSSKVGAFDEHDLRMLEVLAEMASLSICYIFRAHQLRVLNRIGQRLLRVSTLDDVMALLVEELGSLIPLDLLRLEIKSPAGSVARPPLYWFAPDIRPVRPHMDFDQGLIQRARILPAEEVARGLRVAPDDLSCKSFVVVPLRVDTEVHGTLVAGTRHTAAYAHEDLGAVETAAIQAALWVRNHLLYEQLRLQNERVEAFFAYSSDAVLMLAKDRIVNLNEAACRLLGIEAEDCVGRRREEVLELAPVTTREPGASPLYVLSTPRGEREVEMNESGIVVEGVEHRIVTLRDVTEQRDLDRAKANFISMVSHELRTPLNSVLGFSDILITGAPGPLTERQHEFLEHIRSSSRHLVQLVNDILDLSRLDAGAFSLSRGPFLPGMLAQQVAAEMSGLAREAGVDLDLKVAEALPKADGDGGRIKQVLINLVGNALKFTPEGGSVTVEVEAGEDEVTFSVRDTGPGIPEAEQGKVFERFYQSVQSPRLATKGSGLGLTIAKLLVERHGGRIWIESEPGRGSTFRFTVPAIPEVRRDQVGASAQD